MLFRVFLGLIAGALALLFAGFVLQKLALESVAATIDTLGVAILLAGFALLPALGVFYAANLIAADIAHYFSGKEGARRKLWFAQAVRRDLEQRRAGELQQIGYFHASRRARLLRANNRKHLRLLAKSLYRQLRAARGNMPQPLYKKLKQAIRLYCRRDDGEALLALQKRIAAF
jgi:hypothetical protein